MEKYLRENFDVESKNSSDEALRRWRSAVSMVKNPRRRFRVVADLAKRAEAERKRRKLQRFYQVLDPLKTFTVFGAIFFYASKMLPTTSSMLAAENSFLF